MFQQQQQQQESSLNTTFDCPNDGGNNRRGETRASILEAKNFSKNINSGTDPLTRSIRGSFFPVLANEQQRQQQQQQKQQQQQQQRSSSATSGTGQAIISGDVLEKKLIDLEDADRKQHAREFQEWLWDNTDSTNYANNYKNEKKSEDDDNNNNNNYDDIGDPFDDIDFIPIAIDDIHQKQPKQHEEQTGSLK